MAHTPAVQSDFIKNLEFNRFGLTTFLLGFKILAVSPMKWILSAATVSISIDLLLIAYYIFF